MQTIITVAGHFRKTQRQAVIETIINLVTTFVLVFRYGINGALLGTIAALLYRTNDMILYANHRILGRKAVKTYRRILRNFGLLLLIVFVTRYTPLKANSYTALVLSAIIYTTIIITLFVVVNLIAEKNMRYLLKEFLYSKLILRDQKKFYNCQGRYRGFWQRYGRGNRMPIEVEQQGDGKLPVPAIQKHGK